MSPMKKSFAAKTENSAKKASSKKKYAALSSTLRFDQENDSAFSPVKRAPTASPVKKTTSIPKQSKGESPMKSSQK